MKQNSKQLRIQPIPRHSQGSLFEVEYGGDIKSPGQARTSSGARIEDFVCKSLNLISIPLNGSYDVNFDAGLVLGDTEVFIEIKSLRKSGKSPLYVWRLDKEIQAQKQIGTPVLYLFCVHSIKGAKNQQEITHGLTHKPVILCIATLDEVRDWIEGLSIKVVKTDGTSNGYNREGYKEGYVNLPQKKIVSMCTEATERIVTVLEHQRSIEIRFSPGVNDKVKEFILL